MLFAARYWGRNSRAVDRSWNALISFSFVETLGKPRGIFFRLSNDKVEMLIERFFTFFFQPCLLFVLDELQSENSLLYHWSSKSNLTLIKSVRITENPNKNNSLNLFENLENFLIFHF